MGMSCLVGVELCWNRVLIFQMGRFRHLLLAVCQRGRVAATCRGGVLMTIGVALVGGSRRLLLSTLEEYLLVDRVCAVIPIASPKPI